MVTTIGETGLEFGVLGPLLMNVDGRPVPLGAPKQRAVMAMLVLDRNHPVDTDRLITAVWGEAPVPAARVTAQSYVSNLRRLFSIAGLNSREVLANAPRGYRLNIADTACDLGRFNTKRIAGLQAAAAGQFEDATGHLSAALAEWRGPVLEDLSDFAFVEPWATALTEDKLLAHTARTEVEIACGRAETVIGELAKLAAEYPLREPLWAQLITAYYLVERQSEALDAFQRLKTTLAEELGIDPGPTVRALYEKVLRQEPLDVKRTAQATAAETFIRSKRPAVAPTSVLIAELRDTAGHHYRLEAADVRIGRLADNDIVLGDADVSRHHAVIVNTGTSFVIVDLHSANGIEVQGRRIAVSSDLADGDFIRIGGHELIFEIHSQ